MAMEHKFNLMEKVEKLEYYLLLRANKKEKQIIPT